MEDLYQTLLRERDNMMDLLEEGSFRKVDGSGFDFNDNEADFSYSVGDSGQERRFAVTIRALDEHSGALDFSRVLCDEIIQLLTLSYQWGNKTCVFPKSWDTVLMDMADRDLIDFRYSHDGKACLTWFTESGRTAAFNVKEGNDDPRNE